MGATSFDLRRDAVIFDLDGVLTDTARVHADAWKQLFDEYLEQRPGGPGEDHRPFTMDDYRRTVDGKPRFDGVESFLASRGIELPHGESSDPPGRETIRGLGELKNQYFHERLEHDAVEVFDDARPLLERLRDAGVPTAVISSSRNCEHVLRAAGLDHLFDARVDGAVADELDLPGKPDPAILLEAASRLGVAAEDSVVIEDARAGVEAGRRAGFALVVGVDRDEQGGLDDAGADVVVTELSDSRLEIGGPGASGDGITTAPRDIDDLPDALGHWPQLLERLSGRRPVLFCDFDGTLAPIVDDPASVRLPGDASGALRRAAESATVAVISGRDLRDIRERVGIEGIWYAGSHGFEFYGPNGEHHEVDDAVDALAALDRAERDLGELEGEIPGARVERKRFSIATHHREASEEGAAELVDAVGEVAERHGLRWSEDRKVVEVRPAVDWHKGSAVRLLMRELELDHEDVVPIFIGDGATDEDAFETIGDAGIGIVVRHEERSSPSTAAMFSIGGLDAVPDLLDRFADLLAHTSGAS